MLVRKKSSHEVATARVIVAAAFAWTLVAACGGTPDEPTVPVSTGPAGGSVIKMPISGDGTVDTAGMARLGFGESRYDFGTVDEGAVVTHRFAFRNTGGRPLTITSASSSCGCTVPSYPRAPVAPGDTSSIFVRFDTEGKAGVQDKVVTVTANTYPNQTTFHLTGTVDAPN